MPVKQKTIAYEIELEDIGTFSGQRTRMRLCPAGEHEGIYFIQHTGKDRARVDCRTPNVVDTEKCTTLGDHKGARILVVEHLLSAMYALGVTNLMVELHGPEIPLFDGGPEVFHSRALEAGIEEQDATAQLLEIDRTYTFQDADGFILAFPCDEFRISYLFEHPYDQTKLQAVELPITGESYRRELLKARTWITDNEAEIALSSGMVKYGSPETTSTVVSRDGTSRPLNYQDEFARHKIVDIIGDLSLLGRRLKMHVIGVRSGHRFNHELARLIWADHPLPGAS
jgi:UDP-3-O-[3-hydroxymyristoyl] N-acetylglucosamine deacetylase